MLSRQVKMHELKDHEKVLLPTYGRRELDQAVPKYEVPDDGMPARTAPAAAAR